MMILKRLLSVILIVLFIALITLAYVGQLWLVYWILTGRIAMTDICNLFNKVDPCWEYESKW